MKNIVLRVGDCEPKAYSRTVTGASDHRAFALGGQLLYNDFGAAAW